MQNIFSNCSLKINKIFLKSFIKGALISDSENKETFFQIELNEHNSKIFFFENNSLKFQQSFKFGSEIVINDIVKITSLKKNTVRKILNEINLESEMLVNELIEKQFFSKDIYKKIKKKLIYDIVLARLNEILELILFKNINIKRPTKEKIPVFFENNNFLQLKIVEEILNKNFKDYNNFDLKFLEAI